MKRRKNFCRLRIWDGMSFYWERRCRPFWVYLYTGRRIVKDASWKKSSFESCFCVVGMGMDLKTLTKAEF